MHAFASYFAFNTLDSLAALPLKDKLALIAEKIEAAAGNIKKAATDMKAGDYVGFFAVPEYYFLKNMSEADEASLYSENEMTSVIQALVSASEKHRRLAILPGTVNWRRKAPGGSAKKYDGFSSVPVIFDGELIHTYNKVMNDGTIDRIPETRYVPGKETPVFKVRDLQCGVEICGDFNQGNLRKAVPNGNPLDFEFMMSGTNFHNFSPHKMDDIPVRNGGYFLHVDQDPKRGKNYNGVWCVSRGSGWHSLCSGNLRGTIYDPWTGARLSEDMFGQKPSAGHVLVVSIERASSNATGMTLPGRKPIAGLKLQIDSTKIISTLDAISNTWEIRIDVELMAGAPNVTSPPDNRTVQFRAQGASARHSSAQTDGAGKASCVFVCRKDQAARLTASFHGADVLVTTRVAWLGPGEVTKMSPMKMLAHEEVPTFYTPTP